MKYALISAALALASLPALAFAPAFAPAFAHDRWDDGERTKSVDVYTGDLNPSRPADAHEAYGRIRHAARHVCGPRPDTNDRIAMHDYRVCRAEATDDAVGQLDDAATPRGRDAPYPQEDEDSRRW